MALEMGRERDRRVKDTGLPGPGPCAEEDSGGSRRAVPSDCRAGVRFVAGQVIQRATAAAESTSARVRSTISPIP